MKNLIPLTILLALLFSCNTKELNDIIFEGITKTDVKGQVISYDHTDWNFNDEWKDKEKNLFDIKHDTQCESGDIQYEIIAYPNPSAYSFFLFHKIDENRSLSYKIVDKDFNVVLSKENAASNEQFLLDENKFKSGDILRIYYKVLGENCEMKGHGDIKIL